ncbi:Serine/threonine-protein phosphatase 2A activator 1 [Cryptotrichosporon argae]
MSTSTDVLLPSDPALPVRRLTTNAAVAQWPLTPGYRGFVGWLRRRCARVRGRGVLVGDYASSGAAVQTLMRLLEAMTAWVAEAPPQPQAAQRFGNLAFRAYIKIVEERVPAFFDAAPPALRSQLRALLVDSHAFGHPTRLDYGTGHELAFALGLWCVVVSGWTADEDEEDELVLRVFARYLELTTLLQMTYRLEPAGSHGVWGLDDYSFLPYLFGSAQLLDGDLGPADALKVALDPASVAVVAPADLDAAGTTTIARAWPAGGAAAAARHGRPAGSGAGALRPPAPSASSGTALTDLYTLSLARLTLFKTGAAFSEHSPLLHSLSTFPSWTKPHAGLHKMYAAEVLGKRVVVQGLSIGGWCWGLDDGDGDAAGEVRAGAGDGSEHTHLATAARTDTPGDTRGPVTPAPWARQDTQMAAPWAASRARVDEANRQWGA